MKKPSLTLKSVKGFKIVWMFYKGHISFLSELKCLYSESWYKWEITDFPVSSKNNFYHIKDKLFHFYILKNPIISQCHKFM